MNAFHAIVAAPGFSVGIVCADEAVVQLRFLPLQPALPAADALAREAARQVSAWLIDARFVFDLPLHSEGTPFQHRVWGQIATIPTGSTRTYGDIAKALGSSPRPVGGACGANPLPIVVPCHRVVGASGLGGFNRQHGGFLLDIKRWLLQHEGVNVAAH